MTRKIEKLLRVTADFQRFTDSGCAGTQDELSEEDLILVAAAQSVVRVPESKTESAGIISSKK